MIVLKVFFFFFIEEKELIEIRKGLLLFFIFKFFSFGKVVFLNVLIILIMGELARSKLTYYEIMIIIFRK